MKAVICEAPGALHAIDVAPPEHPVSGGPRRGAGAGGSRGHQPLSRLRRLHNMPSAQAELLRPGGGARRASRRGLCEQLVLPAANLYAADGLSTRDAAMVEFLAIGAHAVRRSMARPGARSLVRGAGPIGLGVAIFARIAGLAVTMVDTAEERLDFAREKLGFASTLSVGPQLDANITAITEGFGFDAVFDATGSARSMEAAFSQVAHGGNLILVGIVRDEIAFSDPEFHKREMMLIGSRNATREDFELVIAAIRDGLVATDLLATHTTNLDTVADDLQRWARDKSGLVKAIVEIAGAEQDAFCRSGNTAGPPA